MGGRAALGGVDVSHEPWPAWATEPVRIVGYDPAWPVRARGLAAHVGAALNAAVEHVGSTAVPGLAAKPVIDLMAATAVVDEAAGERAAAALAGFGWELVPPELDARPYRRLLVLVEGGHRAAHLHLISPVHPSWAEQLAFRDALRADKGLRDRYAVLKRRLAAQTADREDYTRSKGEFVRSALASR